jgi:uncharacterized membrane protein
MKRPYGRFKSPPEIPWLHNWIAISNALEVSLPELQADYPSTSAASIATAIPRFPRVETVDLLRGLLMILMALDHARDFFSGAGVNPTDPLNSWPALFATRWVTHLCAPGFVALAGTSVYLQRARGKSQSEIARLLVTRGLWLILLELTLISFSWSLTLFAPFFQVIWAVGVAMVLLAGLQYLPAKAVGIIGAAIVILHNLLDPIQSSSLGVFANLWTLMLGRGPLIFDGRPFGFVAYSAIPWTGAICLGYAFGPTVLAHQVLARLSFWKRALPGIVLLAAFALVRIFSSYGDATRWQPLPNPTQSAMSFLNLQKYPPSLEYYLATFGVLLILYAIFDSAARHNWVSPLRSFIKTYGEVPFFYYVPHIWLLHIATVLVALATGQDWHIWLQPRVIFLSGPPPGWGFNLPFVYAIWAAVVLALYLPCRWFSRYKYQHRYWWLSYL